jgi:hypothetical protein
MLDPGPLGLRPREQEVYRKSRRIAFEINFDEQANAELADDTSPSQIISPSLFDATRQAWDRARIPEPPHLDRLPPLLAAFRLLYLSVQSRGIFIVAIGTLGAPPTDSRH